MFVLHIVSGGGDAEAAGSTYFINNSIVQPWNFSTQHPPKMCVFYLERKWWQKIQSNFRIIVYAKKCQCLDNEHVKQKIHTIGIKRFWHIKCHCYIWLRKSVCIYFAIWSNFMCRFLPEDRCGRKNDLKSEIRGGFTGTVTAVLIYGFCTVLYCVGGEHWGKSITFPKIAGAESEGKHYEINHPTLSCPFGLLASSVVRTKRKP